jgi:hypothetical protein
MKNVLFVVSTLVVLAISVNSCKEDIELIGDFVETAVVYGLLDQSEDIHMIKITRTFIGPGDATEIAQIPDSSYFQSVIGTVIEFIDDVPGRIFTLTDTLVENKDPNGAFYAPQQKLYYFETLPSEPLLGNAEYELNLVINNGEFNVYGRTVMVNGITNNISGQTQPFKFITNNAAQDYKSSPVTVSNLATAHQVNVTLRVEFTEWIGTASSIKSFDWKIGESVILQGENSKTFSAHGQLFYDLMRDNCTNDPSIDKRTFNSISTIITGGAEDFVNYILINEPSSSLAQNKPTFTNLSATNGYGIIGIFSARETTTTFKPFIDPSLVPYIRVIDKITTNKLCTGPITGPYLFCSDHPADNSEFWSCN